MISVLVVDDSALIRRVLTKIIDSDPEMEVIGTAADPYIARDKIKSLHPDVITLDIEMPKMDGIKFLKNLMRLRPMPVVMISTLTQKGAPATLEALEIGAVDYVGKPSADNPDLLADYAEEILQKIRVAGQANIARLEWQASGKSIQSAPARRTGITSTGKLIAIGASTGGTEAIRELLLSMPLDSPPIVITQHIPPVFSTSFAKRLDDMLPLTVHEATDGDKIIPGHVYIAPGDLHMEIKLKGGHYYCRVFDGERVNLHKPSVEVLFNSITEQCAKQTIGIMLTGMGADGAKAMLRMKEAGSYNIVQDQASSVVWGMPGEAVSLGAANEEMPLKSIPDAIIKRLKNMA